MEGPARLYRNRGDGTFVDVAPELGIVGPPHGFTCMFWDYDDDGRLDIFVGDYSSNLSEVVADYLGLPVHSDDHAHLYHNLGPDGFREVSREAGLARPMPVMSVNAGDIDNDGDLDLHLGTGWMSLSGLVPDLMYVNVGRPVRGRDRIDRHRPPPEGARRLVRRLGRRRRPRPLRRPRRRLPRRPRLQRPVPEPRPRASLAEGQARRHQDQRSAIGAKLRVDLAGPAAPARSTA